MLSPAIKNTIRYVSLFIVLSFCAWMLLPAQEDDGGADDGGGVSDSGSRSDRDVEHVIKFSPGMAYMPGISPFGMGDALTGLRDVIRDFERRFPDTRIEVLNVPVALREYLVTQLSSGNAPDIINVNVEDVWVDVQKGWYVPLDKWLEAPNEFIREKGDPTLPGYDQWWDMFKYQAISRGKAAPDSKNYCISLDMIETGIFYNKNALAEVGEDVPETWEDFIRALAKLKDADYIPLALNIDVFNDWAVDLFFDQLYYPILPGIDLSKDPLREGYLEGYLDWDELAFLHEKGFFTKDDPRYHEIWRIMYDLRQYCVKGLTSSDTVREFVTGQAAMTWNANVLVYRLLIDQEIEFDWGVFYLPPFTKETSRFANGHDMCVIGGSATQLEVTNRAYADTGDPETSERLKRVMQFLQFICVPENNERIVNEYECYLPNIIGVPVLPALKPFERFLERRYTTTKWIFSFDLRFSDIQRRMLELYLNDGVTHEEFMTWQVNNLDAACTNLMVRKEVEMEGLEKRWQELAPVRAQYEGLPNE